MWVQTDCQVRGTDGLILDLIYLEDRWKIHWRRQIHHVVYGIPMQDQKILRKTESGIPPKVYRIPMYRNSMCWQSFDTHIVFQVIIFNYQKCILLFFLKHARPDSVDRAVGLGQVAVSRVRGLYSGSLLLEAQLSLSCFCCCRRSMVPLYLIFTSGLPVPLISLEVRIWCLIQKHTSNILLRLSWQLTGRCFY